MVDFDLKEKKELNKENTPIPTFNKIPIYSSLDQAQKNNPSLFTKICAIIEAKIKGQSIYALAKSLNISNGYLSSINKGYFSLINKEVIKLKQLSTEVKKGPKAEALKFLEDKAPHFAMTLYFISILGTPRERRQAAKDALDIIKVGEATRPPPPLDETMKKLVRQTFSITLEKEEKEITCSTEEEKP